jgi:hypothetical protein
MLENLAFEFVNLSVQNRRLIGFGLMVVGAIVAGLTHQSASELRRAPYFAFSCLLILLSVSGQLVWLESSAAMSNGYLWVLMFCDMLVDVLVGYGFGVVGIARSLDAYGQRRMAVLAFIPIANLWLLLTPSKNDTSVNRMSTPRAFTGETGVLLGFGVTFAGIILGIAIGKEVERRATVAQSDPAVQRVGVDLMIRSKGLDSTLRQLAQEVPIPDTIDDTTTLIRVEGNGSTLRYTYQVSTEVGDLPESYSAELVAQNCNFIAMRPVIDAGGGLQHVYLRKDGSEIGTVSVNKYICGF